NTSKYARQDKNVYQEIKRQSRDAARQMAYIYNTSLYPAYKNTETEYYPMGEDFFAGLVEALKNAKRYIFLEFFIVKKGYMWDTILDILKQKAAEGVDVRFMYDDIGCMDLLPRYYYKTLNKYGIRCSVFNRLRPVINSMFNNRDHRKIVAIDGHTAFVCGANIGDEYINKKERFGTWKDSGLRLKGDGAWGFTLMFSQLWDYTMNETTDPQTLLPLDEEIEGIESDGYVQPYADNPVDDIRLAENVYLNIISKAERYVFINTPYLILNDNLRLALIAAAESGVDVRITTPHIPDKKVVFLLTRANYKPLLEAGVKIYEYTPGFMHAKSYVCDDQFAVIGTINTDYRSLFLHFECAAFMYGTSSVMALKHDYIKTLDVCTQVTMQDVQRTPWHQKAAQYILKIFAPLI
ncbi:MAG: cardiolipin synthase, partial [Christensenellaceae bacterium]